MGVTLSKNIGGVSVGAEFSYRQNMPLLSDPVLVLPAPLVPNSAGLDRDRQPSRANGTPGALGDTTTASSTRCGRRAKTPLFDSASFQAELTWMHWAKVTQNEAVFKGRDSYTGIDKVVARFRRPRLQLHADLVPGVARAWTCWRRCPYSRGLNGNAAVFLGGNEERRQLRASASPPTSIRSTGSTSSTPATSATTRPTPATGAATDVQRRLRVAVRSRLGVAHVQDHVLRRTHMFRKTLIALRFRIARAPAPSRRCPPTKRSSSAPR